MSFKLFKQSKSARRHIANVFFNIQAVDKHLKPSYLWDAFHADISEVKLYLKELHLLGLIDRKLSIFSVKGTIFVTDGDFLQRYVDTFCVANVGVIDISGKKPWPYLLDTEEKAKVLSPVIKTIKHLLEILDTEFSNENVENIEASCNLSTLFGVLVGYPVLYWYSSQCPHSDFTCLSMVPLKVYRVTSEVNSIERPNNNIVSASLPYKLELYNFSIPETICTETNHLVYNWFDLLLVKCKNSIFFNPKIGHSTVTLPNVAM